MSHVQQTCPLCQWSRFVRVPQTADHEFDDLIARHVGRSLQWEWQAHVHRDHAAGMAKAYDALTLAGFDEWVAQEGAQVTVETETPPSEGVGKTVRFDLPTITPEQARNLAEAVEHTMISAAAGIQRFAETMVPALHSAQAQLVNGLRAIVEKQSGACSCQGVPDHQRGGPSCLFLDADGTLNPDPRPYGTVKTEICSCCLRVQGEPHQFPNCDLVDQP